MHLNNINFMYPKFQETNKQKSSSVSFKGKTEFLSLSNLSQIPNRTFNGAIIQVGERLYQIWNNSKDVTEINQNIYDIDKVIISGKCPNLKKITVSYAQIKDAYLPNLEEIYCSNGYYGYDDLMGNLDILNSEIGSYNHPLVINGAPSGIKQTTPNRQLCVRTRESHLYCSRYSSNNAYIISDVHNEAENKHFNEPLKIRRIDPLALYVSLPHKRNLSTSSSDMDYDF